jgi:hypothetical protein
MLVLPLPRHMACRDLLDIDVCLDHLRFHFEFGQEFPAMETEPSQSLLSTERFYCAELETKSMESVSPQFTTNQSYSSIIQSFFKKNGNLKFFPH